MTTCLFYYTEMVVKIQTKAEIRKATKNNIKKNNFYLKHVKKKWGGKSPELRYEFHGYNKLFFFLSAVVAFHTTKQPRLERLPNHHHHHLCFHLIITITTSITTTTAINSSTQPNS